MRTNANNIYKTCRQNYFVNFNSGLPARLIYQRWQQFYQMRLFILAIATIILSCGSIGTKKSFDYLAPYSIKPRSSISQLSSAIPIDTTRYFLAGRKRDIREYRITKLELERLRLGNNLFDSVDFRFHAGQLLGTVFYLSDNQKMEILKYSFPGKHKMLETEINFSGKNLNSNPDTTFEMGKYRGLVYRFKRKKQLYVYTEDMIDNVATLYVADLAALKVQFINQ